MADEKPIDYPRLPDGTLDVHEMARVVAERRAVDPVFDAECRRDVEDFFKPSPLFQFLRKGEDS